MSVPAETAEPSLPNLERLFVRVRADLTVSRQTHQDRPYYVIKDPVSLRYFRVSQAEHMVFSLLDGRRSLAEVLALVRQRYPHLDLTPEDLLLFINQLKNANFLETVAPQQGALLYERARLKRRMKSLRRQIQGILYIKIPLYDPDRLFNRVLPYVRFLWSRWFFALLCLSFLSAVFIVVNHWDEMEFSLSALISPSSLFFFWIALVLTKVVHELAHGLTCKHFGGEVHEMGFLLLVLTPCLYCNISDAWTFQSHWKKFATSFAGIFAELVLASWAAIIWWLTAPGLINSLAYRVMFLASISSILINGNPLMRWDGYYILSDLLGMPNLRQNSFAYLKRFLRRYILGMPVPEAELSTRAHQIQLFYGVAATLWLVSVLTGICIAFLVKLPPLGLWITASTLYGLVLRPTGRLFTYLQNNREHIPLLRWPRVLVPTAVVAAAVYLAGFLSLPTWVEAPCVVLPEERAAVRSEVAGFVDGVLVKEGERVRAGQPLVRLTNPRVRLQLLTQQKALEVLDVQLSEALSRERMVEAALLRESRAARLAQIRELRHRVENLVLRAPIDGVVLTPRLDWLIGVYVREGQEVCEVAALDSMLARIVVDERDLEGLTVGVPAQVRLRAYPGRTFSGKVLEVSPRALQQVPDEALSSQAGGDVPTYVDARARRVPTVQLYELTIRLTNPEGRLRPGMTGWAKIRGPARTLVAKALARIQKALKTSFHLR